MNLYIARHAQTNYNIDNLSNSDPSVDVHLTEIGKTQSESLANSLKAASFEIIYISDLRRTQQTANIINQFHHKPVIIDTRLTDINMGFEGKSVDDFKAALAASNDMWNARFNTGESLNDVRLRVAAFLDELRQQKYNDVLIVTSLAIIKMINGIINNIDEKEILNFEFTQGTVQIFELS